MDEKIFKDQLSFQPQIENKLLETFVFDNVIVGGMGGSALPARVMFYLDPVYPLWLHNDFGLPRKTEGKPLFVAISYSGNTAEPLSFAREAHQKNFPLVIITSGGALKELAEKENITYILVPEGFQPRDAVIYMLKALLAVLGKEDLAHQAGLLEIDPDAKDLADYIGNDEVLIYSSHEDAPLGYIWKIYLNESAKIPAFCNVFPELFHNELESLDASKKIIFLSESKNFSKMAASQGWNVREAVSGRSKIENLLINLILARAVARRIAEVRGIDPDRVPLIEEFKKL